MGANQACPNPLSHQTLSIDNTTPEEPCHSNKATAVKQTAEANNKVWAGNMVLHVAFILNINTYTDIPTNTQTCCRGTNAMQQHGLTISLASMTAG